MKIESFWKNCSIVIPCRSDESRQCDLLSDLSMLTTNAEILVIQSKPSLMTSAGAPNQSRVKYFATKPSRAIQLNYGARIASRKFIWFLHADTRLETRAIEKLRAIRAIDTETIYYFKLGFQLDGPKRCALNALGANMRSQFFKMPFGDQSYMLSKKLFLQLKGFNEDLDYAEDFDFIKRAAHLRINIESIPIKVLTSARKYQQQGWLKTTFEHLNYVAKNW
ncbi:MAG: hypothetical protein COV44_05775 [Deltaproteobacteria bacterium CG11_big_fil_rev_8_21_14_0_20_45_16]|nr:MAG: hypothetical protein COV44_05775 [Deltaproteobacteria bacterium CG11_big_fil_rev_8_21_14_0_20_45_16]